MSAVAKLGKNKKIISVTAIHKRETPLVEALAKASVKDTIEVDFTGYNNTHPRVVNGYRMKVSTRVANTIPPNTDFVILTH